MLCRGVLFRVMLCCVVLCCVMLCMQLKKEFEQEMKKLQEAEAQRPKK